MGPTLASHLRSRNMKLQGAVFSDTQVAMVQGTASRFMTARPVNLWRI
jgi:hypothetical protein